MLQYVLHVLYGMNSDDILRTVGFFVGVGNMYNTFKKPEQVA
jgi:hypothetical protein